MQSAVAKFVKRAAAEDSRLRFDEATHTYFLDGTEIPGVTRVIGAVHDQFKQVPPDVLKRACERGTAVHMAAELYDTGKLDLASIDEAIAGYVVGWIKATNDLRLKFLHIETMAYSAKYRYACRLDRIGISNILRDVRKEPRPCVIEIKTMAQPSRLTGEQLAAQEFAARERLLLDGGPTKRYAVHVYQDGTYSLEPYESKADWPRFLKDLNTYRKMTTCKSLN